MPDAAVAEPGTAQGALRVVGPAYPEIIERLTSSAAITQDEANLFLHNYYAFEERRRDFAERYRSLWVAACGTEFLHDGSLENLRYELARREHGRFAYIEQVL